MDKSLEKQLALWLKAQKAACGPYLFLSVVLGVLSGMLLIAQAFLIAKLLAAVVMDGAVPTLFIREFALLGGLIALRALAAFGRERVAFEAGRRLRADLRARVLNQLTLLGPAFIKGKPLGSWGTLVLEQIEDLHDFYARYLPQLSIAACIPLIILACVFPMNWAAGLILLGTAPLIPLFMILVGMSAADANRKHFAALSRLSGHFMDRLRGLSTLKLFHRAEAEGRAIEKASDEFRSRTMSVLRMAFLSSAVLEFFAAISIALVAVYFGFSYLGHLNFGHYDLGISLFTGLFVLMLAPEFYQPLRDMGTHYHAKAQAVAAAENLSELLALAPQQQIKQEPQSRSAEAEHRDATPKHWDIEAKDLYILSHQGGRIAGPLNFSIKAGERVAIVGVSGAGKSSLLNAIMGFLPIEGELKIGGLAIETLDLEQLREAIAWLGQEPHLFHGSIRDNVAMGRELSDSEIVTLLEKAQIADFVTSLSAGLDHGLGEGGQGVSVGQAQRLALARALAQRPQVFLLDEPGASLDIDSERKVMAALARETENCTVLMVSHRLDLLAEMDKVLVLEGGKVVESGTASELASRGGALAGLLAAAGIQPAMEVGA
ncbi:cysteine/glutathione ABC transporter permease/ATP-binding protein CydD [Shewanella sp. JM162201]|uniref:Cysteine/glutathione ABC transporter permease/ATP-binding protein CydD n=1 Tax=Shewanella jiangmenensis TaxID=2837387 RepID=A0ABS5V4B5_9GAMM|nr:cysteine/glutathione ABC transporter permease/ATP-binding protein CydD [Shewanella jiangmenensis]MBT1444544.1 cysteine/glutathione ABC transporter permease/ATP-binding protein CydD [Shewanella jiangmenensis]